MSTSGWRFVACGLAGLVVWLLTSNPKLGVTTLLLTLVATWSPVSPRRVFLAVGFMTAVMLLFHYMKWPGG